MHSGLFQDDLEQDQNSGLFCPQLWAEKPLYWSYYSSNLQSNTVNPVIKLSIPGNVLMCFKSGVGTGHVHFLSFATIQGAVLHGLSIAYNS